MQAKNAIKRLLVLDVDHTLLHLPTYDPVINILAGGNLSQQEFYEQLPSGGLHVEKGSTLKVYPRPHLLPFLDGAEGLGYELALFTTAKEGYIEKLLPLCGVDLKRFVAIIAREKLTPRGGCRVKDLTQFLDLGYLIENIVVIDDLRDIYVQPQSVLQIPAFRVTNKSFEEDCELLSMLQRLKYLGSQSLLEVRANHLNHSQREAKIRDLALTAFDSKKYGDLSLRPYICEKVCIDIEQYPDISPPIETSFNQFLVYKQRGLVGKVERDGLKLRVSNLCSDVWKEVPAGTFGITLNEDLIEKNLSIGDRERLQELCRFLGYAVESDDFLTLAAITLHPIGNGSLHVLAYRKSMLDDIDPT